MSIISDIPYSQLIWLFLFMLLPFKIIASDKVYTNSGKLLTPFEHEKKHKNNIKHSHAGTENISYMISHYHGQILWGDHLSWEGKKIHSKSSKKTRVMQEKYNKAKKLKTKAEHCMNRPHTTCIERIVAKIEKIESTAYDHNIKINNKETKRLYKEIEKIYRIIRSDYRDRTYYNAAINELRDIKSNPKENKKNKKRLKAIIWFAQQAETKEINQLKQQAIQLVNHSSSQYESKEKDEIEKKAIHSATALQKEAQQLVEISPTDKSAQDALDAANIAVKKAQQALAVAKANNQPKEIRITEDNVLYYFTLYDRNNNKITENITLHPNQTLSLFSQKNKEGCQIILRLNKANKFNTTYENCWLATIKWNPKWGKSNTNQTSFQPHHKAIECKNARNNIVHCLVPNDIAYVTEITYGKLFHGFHMTQQKKPEKNKKSNDPIAKMWSQSLSEDIKNLVDKHCTLTYQYYNKQLDQVSARYYLSTKMLEKNEPFYSLKAKNWEQLPDFIRVKVETTKLVPKGCLPFDKHWDWTIGDQSITKLPLYFKNYCQSIGVLYKH